jgi:hypothetical protein
LSNHRKTDLDLARDDLMSHIHRCGVLKASPEHQTEWLEETVAYLGECHPALTAAEISELKAIGTRFCQPVIPHGKGNTALTVQPEATTGEEVVEGPAEARTESDSRELANV